MKMINTFEVYKIEIDRIVKQEGKDFTVIPLTIKKHEALLNGELIRIQENQLTHCIFDFYGKNTIDLTTVIINVHVPVELKTKGEKMYYTLAKDGFDCNGVHYVRFASGSGQIRRNTITFIRDDIYVEITNRLLCGLTLDDFGNDFNSAKFNAYFGLNMSGCHLLPVSLSPSVCVVDDCEVFRPHELVNHVTEREVDYITLPNEDYILSPDDEDYMITGDVAVRKYDGVEFKIRHGIHKDINVRHYNEIEDSPFINSFDGQGLMDPEWSAKVGEYLNYGYRPSEMIIRCPWCKGLLATVDFKSWFKKHGITEIVDSFGIVRQVENIDVILSKSQFKMHKVYQAKCESMGINAWDYLVDNMQLNNLRWGIVKPNKPDDFEKALNYQYLEALDLTNEEIEQLCQRTIDYFNRLNSGDIEEVYNHLINSVNCYEDVTDDENTNESAINNNAPRFQKALDANPEMIKDRYVRSLILQECENKLNAAKLGKIIVRGNYQFCVADPVAQMEWIAKNHCGLNIDVIGVVPAGCVYSNYWHNAEDNNGVITILRSPLIDRNEIAKRTVIDNPVKEFKYLDSGLILSVHDLTALGCGGCDFDGDILFSTNDMIVANGVFDYGVAKPLYYALSATGITGKVDSENATRADIRGLNSKVGQISNKAASLYAMLKEHEKDSAEYRKIYDSIICLGQVVGMEIDRIKTGIKPTMPLEWKPLQVEWKNRTTIYDDVMITSKEEEQGIYRHNSFVPDVKPYFLKYNYQYLDKDIRQLRYVFNRASVINYGMKLDELANACEIGEATKEMQDFYRMYNNSFPVNDSDCVVNHIAHLFEQFHFDLHRQIAKEGKNMLKGFISDNPTDKTTLDKVCNAYVAYKRFVRMETKRNNTNSKDGKKTIVQSAAERLGAIRTHYKVLLLEMCGSLQNAFDYLVFIARENEKNVWDLLGDDVIRLMR